MKRFLKTILIVLVSLFSRFSLLADSPFQSLYLEEVDNTSGSFINGEKTYRLYALLDSGATLNQIFGDETRPFSIVTTTTFFNQDLFGSHANLQGDVNDGAFGFVPR